MADLHNTVMGKKLIEHTFPEIAKQLERIADSMENNDSALLKSLKSLIEKEPNDQDLGKLIRSIWQKN